MADDEVYVASFTQGDDAALMAAIQAREAVCAPLLKYAAHLLSTTLHACRCMEHALPSVAIHRCAHFRRAVGGNPVQALHKALEDPPYETKTDAVKVTAHHPRRFPAV